MCYGQGVQHSSPIGICTCTCLVLQIKFEMRMAETRRFLFFFNRNSTTIALEKIGLPKQTPSLGFHSARFLWVFTAFALND